MYTIGDLDKFEYFKDVDLRYALDSLTGVLSRGQILEFTKHLIEKNIPFAMGIIDVDNFKIVNDNYGHDYGDQCLTDIAQNLQTYFKDSGLVGRYGGDEFIFIYLGDTCYENVHQMISNMYHEYKVLRKKFSYNGIEHWITSTTGCASFPKDADNYTSLFSKIDKALYRGKSKGRNCFIVYVEEKHKDIDVHKKETSYLPIIFDSINTIFKNKAMIPCDDVVKSALDYLINILHFSQAVFLKPDGTIITNSSNENNGIKNADLSFVKNLFDTEEIFIPENIEDTRENNPSYKYLFDNFHFLTFIASKIKGSEKLYGYLILFEGNVERIWQENDIAILMYLDKLIQLLYNKN